LTDPLFDEFPLEIDTPFSSSFADVSPIDCGTLNQECRGNVSQMFFRSTVMTMPRPKNSEQFAAFRINSNGRMPTRDTFGLSFLGLDAPVFDEMDSA
jgi:hypothetical protein